jgi:biopolymer transport protein ExbD
VIQSDRGVPFGRVVQVMEAARDGGAQDISFLVERDEPR